MTIIKVIASIAIVILALILLRIVISLAASLITIGIFALLVFGVYSLVFNNKDSEE